VQKGKPQPFEKELWFSPATLKFAFLLALKRCA
jgi:hypothetical protein